MLMDVKLIRMNLLTHLNNKERIKGVNILHVVIYKLHFVAGV